MSKKILSITAALLAMAAVTFTSCKDDDDNVTPAQTTSEKLIDGRWQTKWYADDTSGNNMLEENEKEFINVAADGFSSIDFMAGGMRVDSSYSMGTASKDTSTWQLLDDNKIRFVYESGASDTELITTLDGSNLVLRSLTYTPYYWTGYSKF